MGLFSGLLDGALMTGARYGVNPLVFAAIYLGAIPVFLTFSALAVRQYRAGKSAWLPGIGAGFCFVSAYLYALIAGENLPWWSYVLVGVVLGLSAYRTFRGLRAKAGKGGEEAEYDVIVIGAGAAGLNVAVFMNQAGFRVLMIDRSDRHIGGDCLNHGCVPSKALIHAARTVAAAREAGSFGLDVRGAADMKKVRAHVRAAQETIRDHENAAHFRAQGIEVVLGNARFTGPREVTVGDVAYAGRNVVIATGSRPRVPDMPGSELATVHTNETIFGIDSLPGRLAIVGGGPIGIEIGQAFQDLGSQVTIIQRDERILPREDADIIEVLRKRLETGGMAILTGTEVERVTGASELAVRTSQGSLAIGFDALLVAAGREVDLAGLDLERAGIRTEEGALVLDDRLRTTNPRVFACGDVAGQHQFTHAAELHASVILENFFRPLLKRKLVTDHLSWVTFTDPEVATFGLAPEELQRRGVRFRTRTTSFEDDDRAITDGYRYGLLKTHVGRGGRILGGTMVAPHAGELVQELILANRLGLSAGDLFKKTYPYPTATRINRAMALGLFLERLTPGARRVLRILYRALT